MDNIDTEGILYRIISGYYYITHNNEEYKIISASLDIKQKAHNLYNSVLKRNRFDTNHWLRRNQADILLSQNGIWGNEEEEQLKILQTRLEDIKIELYLKYNDPPMKKKIRDSIVTAHKKINEMITKKTSMDHLTLEYYADALKQEYILANTIYKNGKLAFDFDESNQHELHSFIAELKPYSITISELKAVARSELWKSYWTSTNNDVFDPPVYDWSDEKRTLINLTKMYENILENPDRPENAVLEDDDALEGWMIFTQRKLEKERKKNKLMDAVGGKYKNANEIFIVTDSVEEAREVHSLNDAQGMAQINHMKQIMKNSDEPVAWQDLPHVKMQIEKQIQEKNAARGK
tara:strand:- start:4459 stop:5505 length:1047 start_codon:yes stop_codon:yes gene_type:complete